MLAEARRGQLRRRGAAGILAAALAAATACARGNPPDPHYRPSQSVLEVVSVLRRHVPDDTYRFEPARDFTGRNVYRASLLRLESLETLHADALRAGHLDDVIGFAKGRAFERLRAFDLAAQSYRNAAQAEGALRAEALRSAALCDALAEARALGRGTLDAAAADAAAQGETIHAQRRALLEALASQARETTEDHYAAVIREEIERADLERAEKLVDLRRLSADGNVRAVAALQRVILDHRESKLANRHLLRLADLYAELAEEYAAAHPPESIDFDPPAFEELVTAAARLYEAVANQDGATERIEAAQRLEAFVAFTLRVDRDRFSR